MRILVVDDEPQIRKMLVMGLSRNEVSVTEASTSLQALEAVEQFFYDIAILDVGMPGMNGIELLRRLKEASPDTEEIMLTADKSLEKGLEAMRLGAYDYLTKPADLKVLRELCVKASEKAALRRQNALLQRELTFKMVVPKIIGSSQAMQRVLRLITQVAPAASAVLIGGESGTGKELVARAIHDLSPRKDRTFIAVNCGAFQESLLESELFGHKKGAFTGAVQDRPGLFDVADGGTLFLDEVGEMSLPMQVKLLRVLDSQKFRPIGDTREREVDFRLIAATNRDLRQLIEEGRFREDLFFRLDVVSINLPTLRERREDIPEIVDYYLGTQQPAAQPRRASRELLEAFQSYSWPGNIRELLNQLERSAILSQGAELEAIGFPPHGARVAHTQSNHGPEVSSPPRLNLTGTLQEQEQAAIESALDRFSGNVSRSAAALGIDRRTLHRKIKALGLSPKG